MNNYKNDFSVPKIRSSTNSWGHGGPRTSRQNLIRHARLIQEFVRQIQEAPHVVVFTDSDHAGCLKTCQSTSSSKLFNGSHRSTSTTQGVIPLRSEESEFYALVKGTSAGLGAVSMLKDLRVDISRNAQIDKAALEVRIDAAAGRGNTARRGAGRTRHIATPELRVQKLTQDGKVKITKILGVSNPADLGTKRLDGGSWRAR